MPSAARTKSKPKKAVKQEELKTAIKIDILDLRVGDRIVTSWHTRAESDGMTVDEVLDLDGGGRFVNRSIEVKSFEECAGQWRTHVHVNKSMCYDTRGKIWIVKM